MPLIILSTLKTVENNTFLKNRTMLKTFIRVTDSNGNITNWIYENGTTRQL